MYKLLGVYRERQHERLADKRFSCCGELDSVHVLPRNTSSLQLLF